MYISNANIFKPPMIYNELSNKHKGLTPRASPTVHFRKPWGDYYEG